MESATEPAVQRDRPKLFSHFGYYTLSWCLLFTIFAFLTTFTTSDQEAAAGGFWRARVGAGLNGLTFGLVCAVLFTPLQNRFNFPRVKWKSWFFVIGVWMFVKLLYLLVFGRAALG